MRWISEEISWLSIVGTNSINMVWKLHAITQLGQSLAQKLDYAGNRVAYYQEFITIRVCNCHVVSTIYHHLCSMTWQTVHVVNMYIGCVNSVVITMLLLLHHCLLTSYCRDGGSWYHMAVAHSELLMLWTLDTMNHLCRLRTLQDVHCGGYDPGSESRLK